MALGDILTNRNRLSDDIIQDVQGAAGDYGVAIRRADVKDLVFPGNLQEIMNRVLATERTSQAQLVEARTQAEAQRIAAEAARRRQAALDAETRLLAARADADARRIQTEADVAAVRAQAEAAGACARHPALLRLRELETLRELARNGNARIYIGFDKHADATPPGEER